MLDNPREGSIPAWRGQVLTFCFRRDPAARRRRRELIEVCLKGLQAAVRSLHPANFAGRLRRCSLLTVLLVAAVALTLARSMDLLIFSGIPEDAPLFFTTATAVPLVTTIPALCVRRLRDAGCEVRAALLMLVPVIGWVMLVTLLARPSGPSCGQDAQ